MNMDIDAKGALKNMIRGYLDKPASAVFIRRSLEILDASPDNKESFIAAVTQISKRIALFVDKNLAQTVYEGLMAAIEKLASPQGTRRRYRRVNFDKEVSITCSGKQYKLVSANLSEGGIFIKAKDLLPTSSEIEITLPLGLGRRIHLTGVVIHKRAPHSETSRLPSGMGIKFKDISEADAVSLRNYVEKAGSRDF